jgi:hypothetical protein
MYEPISRTNGQRLDMTALRRLCYDAVHKHRCGGVRHRVGQGEVVSIPWTALTDWESVCASRRAPTL